MKTLTVISDGKPITWQIDENYLTIINCFDDEKNRAYKIYHHIMWKSISEIYFSEPYYSDDSCTGGINVTAGHDNSIGYPVSSEAEAREFYLELLKKVGECK